MFKIYNLQHVLIGEAFTLDIKLSEYKWVSENELVVYNFYYRTVLDLQGTVSVYYNEKHFGDFEVVSLLDTTTTPFGPKAGKLLLEK